MIGSRKQANRRKSGGIIHESTPSQSAAPEDISSLPPECGGIIHESTPSQSAAPEDISSLPPKVPRMSLGARGRS